MSSVRVVGYLRVSSEGQAVDGHSLAAQRAKIEAWCALHDAELVGVYEDAGISGAKLANRPGALAALDAIRIGRATTLVICDLSRLSRSTRELLDVVERYFRTGDRALVSIKESIDTTTAAGRMIVTVLGALSQLEREQTGERVKVALAHVKAQGKRVGGIPFGSRLADDGSTLVDDEREQSVIRRARELRGAGLALRAIGETLSHEGHTSRTGKPWLPAQVARMLDGDRATAVAA